MLARTIGSLRGFLRSVRRTKFSPLARSQPQANALPLVGERLAYGQSTCQRCEAGSRQAEASTAVPAKGNTSAGILTATWNEDSESEPSMTASMSFGFRFRGLRFVEGQNCEAILYDDFSFALVTSYHCSM